MESLSVYIPQDRRIALAQGVELPDHTIGSALFADISGFTPLTEALVQSLGPQRGAEELSRWLNLIYDAIIAEIERFGGSVLIFSGDAITCWFDSHANYQSDNTAGQDDLTGATLRATACAFAMQQAMQQFANVNITNAGVISLAIKIAVSSGPARRFIAGDPEIQLFDILAGTTLDRLILGEHHADKGDIILDESAAAALNNRIHIQDWRVDQDTNSNFAVIDQLTESPTTATLQLSNINLSVEQTRPWLLPPVYDRMISGMGDFLTELRPAIALFMKFGGIDYDNDPEAQSKLNSYIRTVQRILIRYDSYILNLTIGDKGCYLYAGFGAPLAHEDDATRAVSATLELRDLKVEYITNIQIGVSQGRTRIGSYGSTNRRTYSALGDDVNLAARLMQNAPVGEALITSRIRKATAEIFTWEELAPLHVKGKAQPVTVLRLVGEPKRRTIHLHESKYALPMVGREAEMALIESKLDAAQQSQGQIVGITAEIGMGKTRLMAEVIQLAERRKIQGFSGECQSYGMNTSYLVWQNIWQDFFGLDLAASIQEQIQTLERELTRINPTLLPRLPLLAPLLNLHIPDNELTGAFNAKLRKESLEALLVDCLRSRAHEMPLFFVLEDCQWLDPLSRDLLEVIARTIANLPVFIAFAYRPPQLKLQIAPRISQMEHFTEIALTILPPKEVSRLVSLKLNQIYGDNKDIPPALSDGIKARAEGNPFYIEELINYLHDRNIDLQQVDVLQKIELPTSLYSLILSRIDQLTENQKTLLKVASVIGRIFRAAMLWGVSSQLGDRDRVLEDLDVLNKLELTMLDTPDPELAYLFKHVLTQEVAYETLPFAIRAVLHDQIGQFIENTYRTTLNQYTYLLAHHYYLSENTPKKQEYLLQAGEQAQANYANTDAISYYQRLLPLSADEERINVHLKLGQILELEGQWPAADEQYRQALSLSEQYDNKQNQGLAQTAIANLLQRQNRYPEALLWCDKAQQALGQIGDRGGLAKILTISGTVFVRQGKYEDAQVLYGMALEMRKALNHQADIGSILSNMSLVDQLRGDLTKARAYQEESLKIRRELGDKWAIAISLNNIGFIALDQGELSEARDRLEEAVAIQREIGDKWATANALNNLGNAIRDLGDYSTSYKHYIESLTLNHELDDKLALAYVLEDLGGMIALKGDHPAHALKLVANAGTIRESIGAALSAAEQTKLDRMIASARDAFSETEAETLRNEGRSMSRDEVIQLALISN